MKTRLRAGLAVLIVLSVAGAWLSCGSPGAADTALWNPYDLVGEVEPPSTDANRVRAVEEYRGYVYLLTQQGMLYTYDARDLAGRTSFATYAVPIASLEVIVAAGGGGAMLLRNGTWLYACGKYGLAVVDLSTPAQPSVHVPDASAGSFNNMFQSGDRLFLAGWQVAAIYSLEDPSHPTAIGSYDAAGTSVFAAAAYGDHMYVSELVGGVSGGTLRVLDISDPAHPASVYSVPVPELPYHFRLLNGQLIVADSAALSLWSLSNPREPQLLDSQTAGGRVCAVDGGNLVTSSRVFRPDGNHLVEVASFTPGGSQHAGFPHGSAVGSGYVFLAQRARVLILKGLAPPEAWPYQLRLPIVRNR